MEWSKIARTSVGRSAAGSLLLLAASCLGQTPSVQESVTAEPEAVGTGLDQPFWLDPHFPGSSNHGGWYDSDVPWATGSIVRLPVDAEYVGDWNVTISCAGGGTATMRSPVLRATVNGTTRRFVFNHLETIYLGAHGWYNGGAVIGLTGGGTCATGFGKDSSGQTVSSGPHFCNEVEGEDPWTFWNTPARPGYQSTCASSDGTSGASNPTCAGPICGTRRCAPGNWCGTGGRCCSGCGVGCAC